MILRLVDEAVRRERACLQLGLTERCMQRWRSVDVGDDRRAGPKTRPANAFTTAERVKMLEVVNSPKYCNPPPKQVIPRLVDEGRYLGSESTLYRILRATGQNDNGGPMKGSTILATLQHLGIVASLSRPSVSDDNPFSEALFRTLEYRPEYPKKPFAALEPARARVTAFVVGYNTERRHSGIRLVTPDERHEGREQAVRANRVRVYERARRLHPNRWSRRTRNWSRALAVFLNPKRSQDTLDSKLAKESDS